MNQLWKILIIILILISVTTWIAAIQDRVSTLRLIACDVGQGDAILAIKGSFEILTDGGPPNNRVLDCLSRYIPFWDRDIEVVVNTHPQLDHYGGLIEVFKRYKVDYFIANALDSSAWEYKVLKDEVGSRGIKVINPVGGKSIRYGMISYDIFWPSAIFLDKEGNSGKGGKLGTFNSNRDPNDFSVQALISFAKFNALLTGDIGHAMAKQVLENLPGKSIQYIKIPHHGSKSALTADYLSKLTPAVAVISVGKNNNYGHPNGETLKILDDRKIKYYRTDLLGSVVFETDGQTFWLNK